MTNPNPETVNEAVERERNARQGGKQIWTPGQKLPERVKELAAVFFVEAWKSALVKNANLVEFRDNAAETYQGCITMARTLVEIDNTDVRIVSSPTLFVVPGSA